MGGGTEGSDKAEVQVSHLSFSQLVMSSKFKLCLDFDFVKCHQN